MEPTRDGNNQQEGAPAACCPKPPGTLTTQRMILWTMTSSMTDDVMTVDEIVLFLLDNPNIHGWRFATFSSMKMNVQQGLYRMMKRGISANLIKHQDPKRQHEERKNTRKKRGIRQF